MGKINKFANIYDKDGKLIRKVGDTGVLKNYTIEELEKLVDDLTADRDEKGNIKDPRTLNNVNSVLMNQYYNTKKGKERLKEIIQNISEQISKKKEEKPTDEQAKEALESLKKELEENGVEEDPNEIVSQVESNLDEEYVEFKEVKEDDNQV